MSVNGGGMRGWRLRGQGYKREEKTGDGHEEANHSGGSESEGRRARIKTD